MPVDFADRNVKHPMHLWKILVVFFCQVNIFSNLLDNKL